MNYKEKRVREFCLLYASEKIKPIVSCEEISQREVRFLLEAADHILRGMRRILHYLIQENGVDDVLKIFGMPLWYGGVMEVLNNPDCLLPMIRIDAIMDNSGKFWLCEYNIGPSMGGTEIAELGRIDSNEYKFLSPYDILFAYLDDELKRISSNKICILVWDEEDVGEYIHRDWLLQAIKIRMPGVQVMLVDHNNATAHVDNDTLVYRLFSVDSNEKADFIKSISRIAGAVHCDCSGYLMESKVWLAILQKKEYQHLLSREVKDFIQAVIPPAFILDEYNVDYYLQNKNKFFFKKSSGCGGSDVFFGAECPEDFLREKILGSMEKKWVAQNSCAVPVMSVNVLNIDRPVCGYGVYGFFCINGQWISSGGLLRVGMSDTEYVVNVAKGAVTGWVNTNFIK